MGIPHKHAAIIKAWADGAAVEGRLHDGHPWLVLKKPNWVNNFEYRIKPRVFPTTSMTLDDCRRAYNSAGDRFNRSIVAVANADIRQYILDTEAGIKPIMCDEGSISG